MKQFEKGESVYIKTIDNLEVEGVIEAYTSDAVLIKTKNTLVKLHPHEIYLCEKGG